LPGFDGTPVTIPLDPTLSAADNARRLFKRFSRIKAAQPELARRRLAITEQRQYLENAAAMIDIATSADDLRSIREELITEGVVKARRRARGTPRAPSSGPRRFVASTGHEIVVGRTNRENDEVTFTLARPDDLWLHARGMPGAHVIIRSGGRPIPDGAVNEAAQIAAYFSSGRGGPRVPVSYTLRKYVKKPRGAKPGLVTVTNEKTVVVEPKLPEHTESRDCGIAGSRE
jgi:predicted ribosome quality control (RQC) complex YloA/Tae2 family protein